MNLEQQVCTLEQAKRLKELGVKQEGLFMLTEHYDHPDEPPYYIVKPFDKEGYDYVGVAVAFTVAELGEMLPRTIPSDELGSFAIHRNITHHKNKEWYCFYYGLTKTIVDNVYGVTMASCMAAMLIHLLETNIITAQEVNDILK